MSIESKCALYDLVVQLVHDVDMEERGMVTEMDAHHGAYTRLLNEIEVLLKAREEMLIRLVPHIDRNASSLLKMRIYGVNFPVIKSIVSDVEKIEEQIISKIKEINDAAEKAELEEIVFLPDEA